MIPLSSSSSIFFRDFLLTFTWKDLMQWNSTRNFESIRQDHHHLHLLHTMRVQEAKKRVASVFGKNCRHPWPRTFPEIFNRLKANLWLRSKFNNRLYLTSGLFWRGFSFQVMLPTRIDLLRSSMSSVEGKWEHLCIDKLCVQCLFIESKVRIFSKL